MKMHHKLKQCIISEKRCIRVDYLVTEERPSEFCFEVILYHPDGSEEREEIHNMVMSSDDALEFLHLLAQSGNANHFLGHSARHAVGPLAGIERQKVPEWARCHRNDGDPSERRR